MDDTIFNYDAAITSNATNVPWLAMLVISVVVIILFVAMAMVLKRFFNQPELHGMSRDEIKRRWVEIEAVAGSSVMGAKMAIVEADKLLDTALKSMTIPGQTLGERLKFAGYKYPELRHVWNAHRLRNQLVHETSFEISMGQARSAMHEYKKALKVLHVL